MASDHQSQSIKMLCSGLALGVINDLTPKNKFQFLQNIRVLVEGVLQSRPKVDRFLELNYAPDATPVTPEVPYVIVSIQNKGDNTFNRIVGVGSRLFTGATSTLVMKASGFSTVPFTIVVFRPEEAILAYAYIADKLKFVKVSVDDQLSNVGIDAPTSPLTFYIPKPNRKTIDNVTVANIGDWNNLTGTAQTPTTGDRVNTDIIKFLADGAVPGFASIVPTAFTADIQVGAILTLNGADDVYVEEVNPAVNLSGAATVSKISYDVGTTGKCTIVLSTSSVDLERNSILYINSAEYVRVEEVTRDLNGIPSIRTSTTATRAAGNTVVGIAAFRTYVVNSYVATNTITAKYGKTQITASGVSSITKTVDVDLTNANGVPLTDDDFLHCTLRTSDPSVLTEIQFQLGMPDFGENHFFYVITPNFFTGSANQTSSTISVIQQVLQRREIVTRLPQYKIDVLYPEGIDQPDEIQPVGSGTEEGTLGLNQWTEVFIRLGDLQRVGSDPSKTKKDIKKIRISVTSTAAVDIFFDSIWVGGGANLETRVIGFAPYNWVWRVRDPVTKVPSNWSPPLREGVKTSRNAISLKIPTNTYPANYLVDVARYGGSNSDFRIIGSILNDGSDFVDKTSDRTAAQNDPAGRKLPINADKEIFDFYKPFTFLERPIKGTCDVVGTKWIWKTLDKLDVSYPRGVGITINGILNFLYTNPSDTEHVELENDMGSLTGANFEIMAPRVTGKPLPIIFGPWGEGSTGLIIFGLKATDGNLYWLDGNSPDTQSDLNFLEITSPSEVLLTGVIYDGFPIVISNRRSFTIYSSFASGILNFTARENANSRGVFGSYCACVGRDYIYQISENADGIYKTQGGGNPQSITDGVLYNLFPHNGKSPLAVTLVDGTIINPPDFTFPNSQRLFYCKDFVFYRFIDTAGLDRVLVFDERINDWISYDVYLNDKINAFYQEELLSSKELLVGIDGGVGKFADATNREDEITSIVLPFSSDQGDSNLLKQYNEIVIDVNKGETDGFNFRNFLSNGTLAPVGIQKVGVLGSVREKIIKNIDYLARNITTRFSWTLKSKVKLYEEQIYFIPREDQITQRPSDTNDGGFFGEKFWQGVIIEADTFGLDKILKIFTDDDLITPVATFTINHKGKETKAYSFQTPFIAHSVTRQSGDDVAWIFYKEEYKVDKEPELVKVWEGQETTFDILGFKSLKRNGIALRSTASVTLKWIYDGVEEAYVIPSTANLRDKVFFYLRARKGKLIKPRLESAEPFRLYRKDCEVYVRGFNSPNLHEIKTPFGDDSRITEVRI